MINMSTTPSPAAVRAALAIINSTVNPALRHDAVNVNAPHLAQIIERETRLSLLIDALRDAESEIETMLEDLCDAPEKDILAQRTLGTIRDALAAAEAA